MRASVTSRVLAALRQALRLTLRATLLGLVIGFVLVEALAAVFNRTAGDPTGITLTWPPVLSFAPVTLFVHVMAIVFAVLLAYAVGLTVAVTETIRGVIYGAEHVDEAVEKVASGGLNVADALVDAVDGPNRHGFLGKRGPTGASK